MVFCQASSSRPCVLYVLVYKALSQVGFLDKFTNRTADKFFLVHSLSMGCFSRLTKLKHPHWVVDENYIKCSPLPCHLVWTLPWILLIILYDSMFKNQGPNSVNVMGYASNPSTWEAEAGGWLPLRSAWTTQWENLNKGKGRVYLACCSCWPRHLEWDFAQYDPDMIRCLLS